jgi:hypothetical protein
MQKWSNHSSQYLETPGHRKALDLQSTEKLKVRLDNPEVPGRKTQKCPEVGGPALSCHSISTE